MAVGGGEGSQASCQPRSQNSSVAILAQTLLQNLQMTTEKHPSNLACQISRCLDVCGQNGLDNLEHIFGHWGFGSICSGGDFVTVAFDYMSVETGSRLGTRCSRINQVMACEIKPDNRLFIRVQGRSQRLFMDATRLTQPDMKSVCAIAGAPVPVPSCELTAHGTVCKQFSAVCHTSQRIRTLGNVSDASGAAADSSVATIAGVLRYIRVHLPFLPIFENVVPVSFGGLDGIARQVLDALDPLGYVTWLVKTTSRDFGNPQDRCRVYFGGILMPWLTTDERKRESEKLTAAVRAKCALCVSSQLDVPMAAYATRLVPKSVGTGKRKRELSRGNSWVNDHHEHECRMVADGYLGISCHGASSSGSSSFTRHETDEIMNSIVLSNLPQREQDFVRMRVLEFGTALRGQSIALNMTLDYDPRPFPATLFPCITTRLKVLDFSEMKVYTGLEHLKVQLGIHDDEEVARLFPSYNQFTEECYRHMSGNAFSVPEFATVSLCVASSIDLATIKRLTSEHKQMRG